MKPNWRRFQVTLLDRRDDRAGTLSAFLDYNLGNWTFGLRLEVDPCWFDLNLDCGPLGLSFVWWRHHVEFLDETA